MTHCEQEALLESIGGERLMSDVDHLLFESEPFCEKGFVRNGKKKVAVGTLVAQRPPPRSVRAALPHTAPASGYNDKASE